MVQYIHCIYFIKTVSYFSLNFIFQIQPYIFVIKNEWIYNIHSIRVILCAMSSYSVEM